MNIFLISQILKDKPDKTYRYRTSASTYQSLNTYPKTLIIGIYEIEI